MTTLHTDIVTYNQAQEDDNRLICEKLAKTINANLAATENKLWHAAPVWFIRGNPVVGYSVLKAGVRLMFWSGVSFNEPDLQPGTGKFKDASITYTSADQIDGDEIKRWLEKSEKIQWDYKNIVKRRGVLERLDV